MRSVLALPLLVACSSPSGSFDRYLTDWGDRRMICSLGMDATRTWGLDELRAALDRAAAESLVLHTYGHAPTIAFDDYLPMFDYAHEHGVEMMTYSELTDRTPRAGWAFSIDDDEVDTWITWRDRLRAAGTRITFFVTRYEQLTPAKLDELHELAADGHDIEPHGLDHIDADAYVAMYGLDAYIAADVTPDKADFVRDGWSTTTFAYPFGARSAKIDAAVLEQFPFVRTATQDWCVR